MTNHNETVINLVKDAVKNLYKYFIVNDKFIADFIFELACDKVDLSKKISVYSSAKPFLTVWQENLCVGRIWFSQSAKEKYFEFYETEKFFEKINKSSGERT